MLWIAYKNPRCVPIRRWGMCESVTMNQTSTLAWLGIDVWRPRIAPPRASADWLRLAPSSSAPIEGVPPVDRMPDAAPVVPVADGGGAFQWGDPRQSTPPVAAAETGVRSGSALQTPSIEPALAPILTLRVAAPDALPALFAHILNAVPHAVSVRRESTGSEGRPLLRWQGQDWLLSDLLRDPGMKRRLWRTLCVPQAQPG